MVAAAVGPGLRREDFAVIVGWAIWALSQRIWVFGTRTLSWGCVLSTWLKLNRRDLSMFRDSPFLSEDYDQDTLASMQNSSWGGEWAARVRNEESELAIDVISHAAMMLEAEEEEQKQKH
jgi:hypothetical protein